jgi:hypothetical protein
MLYLVIPAQAGIQEFDERAWISGMKNEQSNRAAAENRPEE